MKIKVQTEEIARAIAIVKPAIGGSVPILSMIKLSVLGTTATLSASNLEIWIETSFPVTTEEDGEALIPGNRMAGIVKEIPGEIAIEADETSVKIRGDKSYFNLRTMGVDEFPNRPEQKDTKEIQIDQPEFRRVLREVATAVSTDETRYVLNGINLQFANSELIVVSSDGRRLALTRADITNPDELDRAVIIPSIAIQALNGILGDGECVIQIESSQIAIVCEPTTIILRLIEGKFPNYNQVIPDTSETTIKVDRQKLYKAAKMAAIMADDKTNSVKLEFKDSLIIIAVDPETGDSREEIPLEQSGEDVTIAFNPYYIMDAVKSVDDKIVIIDLIDADNPGVIRAGESFIYIIMPMKL